MTANTSSGGKKSVLVLWPRYNPGTPDVFRLFLDNFDAHIVFVSKGTKVFGNEGDLFSAIADWLPTGHIEFWDYPGYRISEFSLSSAMSLYGRIRKKMKERKWDFIFFSTQAPVHSKFAFWEAKMRGIPCGVKVEQWKKHPDMGIGHRLHQYIGDTIIRNANFAFPHGEAARRYCLSLGRSLPIHILPLFVENQPCEKFGDRFKKFVFCGRLVPEKEPLLAVKAFLSIRSELNQGVRLVIAGDGPLMGDVRCLVESHGEEAVKSVDFIGTYRRDELPAILDESSVLLLPSLNEGWGVVVIEAARLGRPLILSDSVGAAYDLVQEGKNGFVFPTGDQPALEQAMRRIALMDEKNFLFAQQASRKIFEEWNDLGKAKEMLQQCVNTGRGW